MLVPKYLVASGGGAGRATLEDHPVQSAHPSCEHRSRYTQVAQVTAVRLPAGQFTSLALVGLEPLLPQAQSVLVLRAVVAEAHQRETSLRRFDDVAQLRQARFREDLFDKERRSGRVEGSKSSYAIVWSERRPPLAEPARALLEEVACKWRAVPPLEVVASEVLERPDRHDGVVRLLWPVVTPVLEADFHRGPQMAQRRLGPSSRSGR